ncbi:MAG TPA: VOC family protein [Patescibacteria group bacterium]|nr:VOC family protein [Patescibacteria group bacterium]
MVKLNPYINFKDNAREAMEFYKSVFGGELTMSTFKEGMHQDGPEADKIMHAMLIVGPEMTIMASDTPEHMGEYKPLSSMSLSLSGVAADEEKLRGYWDMLIEGGKPFMPLDKAPWGDTFGMLTDKFGVGWMINIEGKKE